MFRLNQTNEKLKILCLHGYRQNGDVFRAKLGVVRKHLKSYAELIFITAPHDVPVKVVDVDDGDTTSNDSSPPTDIEGTEKSWWFNCDDKTFKGTNTNGPAFGFDVSLKLVEESWKALGPFDGLLGFSQGGCFAGLICSLAARGMTCVDPKFVIIVSGFRSGSLAHSNYYEEVISIPSMHMYGSSDQIIPMDMSKSLAEVFENPTHNQHNGFHFFSTAPVPRNIYIEFIRQQLINHLEQKELERPDVAMGELRVSSSDSD